MGVGLVAADFQPNHTRATLRWYNAIPYEPTNFPQIWTACRIDRHRHMAGGFLYFASTELAFSNPERLERLDSRGRISPVHHRCLPVPANETDAARRGRMVNSWVARCPRYHVVE